MKIGFDAKRIVQNFTGLGNYSRYVVEGMARFAPQTQCVLYAPERRESRRLSLFEQACPRAQMITATGGLRSLWRVWGVTRRLQSDGIDLFHGLSNELPLNIHRARGVKSVVTIHDLIFLRYPECYKPIDRLIYTYKFRRACRVADSIIAVSECTKRDIVKFFGIPENKITVIYQGCDPSFRSILTAEERTAVTSKLNLPKRYILNVGSIEERKNVMLAVEALPMITDSEVALLIVGRHTPYALSVMQRARALGVEKRVVMRHDIAFAELPAVYQGAEAFVYPSRFEGFGIPILEALCSQVPVVAATGSCLEEAGGEGSLYVDADDSQALAKCLNNILGNEHLRREMVEKGLHHAAGFSAETQTRQLIDLYQQILQQK